MRPQFQLIEGSRELLIAAVCRGVHAVSTNDIGVSGPGKSPDVTTTRSAPPVAPDLSGQQLKAFGGCRGWGCRRWQVIEEAEAWVQMIMGSVTRAIRPDCPVPFKRPAHVYCARRRHPDPGPEREQNGHHKVCWNYHRKLRDTFGTVRQRRECQVTVCT
ncbi:hypothetical protein BC826DRAFT_971199 [Russula brevipes]|nr:hypothetical protein BC826DRAFT_971199 [Russula brevipes]